MRTRLALVSIMAGCGAPGAPTAEPPASIAAQAIEDPCDSPGDWRPIAALALPGRVDHTAVWTGTEMVMWGGTQSASQPMSDGARYQPETDTWLPTATTSAPLERDDHVAVWTGAEMIVWGGNRGSERRDKLDTGGRYDPARDAWQPTASSGLSPRDDPRAVWTGTEMIVWGGRDAAGHTSDGARYRPDLDRWRPVAAHAAPAPREDHTAVWTGAEMIVWGGWNGDDDARDYALGGGRYDPRTDTWTAISEVGAPTPREDHTALWTGTEMIVWGGVIRDAEGRHQLATGGRYDPATDRWSPITLDDAPTAREDGVVVWTGREMLVWGGQQHDLPMQSGGRYRPASDRWCPLGGDDAPAARRDHAGVWTGTALVLWGGQDPDGAYPATGARFEP